MSKPAKVHSACYDLLASEARIASFVAVAKGDIPQESWFLSSRSHVVVDGRPVLLSWTGTMFEYLMPALLDAFLSRHSAGAQQGSCGASPAGICGRQAHPVGRL